jgi:hypothetical protein
MNLITAVHMQEIDEQSTDAHQKENSFHPFLQPRPALPQFDLRGICPHTGADGQQLRPFVSHYHVG